MSVFVAAIAFGVGGMIAAPVLLILVFAAMAIACRRNERRRGWAVGFLIGIGLALLLEGACWFALSNMRIGG